MDFRTVVAAIVIALEAVLAGMTAYLLLLIAAGALVRPKQPSPARRLRRFAVLVPAHNEELVIGRVLESLSWLDYPRAFFDVHVVADNCTDATADIARAYTPFVYERDDVAEPGKGQALHWLLDRLPAGCDAFAVIDADSIVSPGFLTTMNDYLERGWLAVQGNYGVLNPEQTWVSAMRGLAFSLLHQGRRAGLSAIGASAGLAGNGMVFAAELREARGWDAFGVTEDLELHAQLVAAGVRVGFAPWASVLAEMPTSLATARGQNMRWEQGRLAVARAHAPSLIVAGVKDRDWSKLVAGVDLLVPPFSVLALAGVVLLAVAAAVGSPLAIVLGATVLAGQAAYVVGGLIAARAPLRLWPALALAPVYVLWKGWLYLRALAARGPMVWHKTERESSDEGSQTWQRTSKRA